jgi:serine/threonine protein kinase
VGKNSLSVQSEIGSGALIGTVYKVCGNTSQRIYALKEVICADQNSIDAVMREAKTLAKADHKRIVRIKGCDSYMLSNGDSLFLILTGVLFWRRLELSAKQTQHSRNI